MTHNVNPQSTECHQLLLRLNNSYLAVYSNLPNKTQVRSIRWVIPGQSKRLQRNESDLVTWKSGDELCRWSFYPNQKITKRLSPTGNLPWPSSLLGTTITLHVTSTRTIPAGRYATALYWKWSSHQQLFISMSVRWQGTDWTSAPKTHSCLFFTKLLLVRY